MVAVTMEDQLNDLSSKHTDFDIDTSLSQPQMQKNLKVLETISHGCA